MNWVAPHASDMSRSTGLAKNALQVSRNPGTGSSTAVACSRTGAASSPPFLGSRTKAQTTAAVTRPTTPTQTNARRHEYAAATGAPKPTPTGAPIGGPGVNSPRRVPRLPDGKEAVPIADD